MYYYNVVERTYAYTHCAPIVYRDHPCAPSYFILYGLGLVNAASAVVLNLQSISKILYYLFYNARSYIENNGRSSYNVVVGKTEYYARMTSRRSASSTLTHTISLSRSL